MDMLNIIVCIKQVLDPEAPASAYKIDAEARRVILKGVPPVLSPFDENALEAALRIKDAHESKVTVISAGRNLPKAVLMKSLACGADELVLLEDGAFEEMDSYATAFILATAIKKLGQYDLILTGREAADTNAGAVGSGIAEILGIPGVTIARRVEFNNGKVRVERVVSDGYEVIEAPLPILITVSNELGELRYANVKQLVASRNRPIMTWSANELGVDPSPMKQSRLLRLFIPQKETRCEVVEGESPEEIGANLAIKLREARIL
jgi:electron transfer flavoprotein beta subunit